MITELTPEQEARYGEYVKTWTDYGTCTDPADRPRAEAAIAKMYECAGLTPPTKIIWCDSPLSLQVAYKVLNEENTEEIQKQLAEVPPERREERMLEIVKKVVLGSQPFNFQNSIYGSHDASWLSFYAFFREVCGLVEETQPLEGLTELAKSAGWAIPCEDVCFVSERHNVLKRDAAGLLHSEDGPAVMYPDGYAIYAWHGTQIPAEWIEQKETLTPQTALTWPNVEQRRCAAEILGWEQILSELSPTVIDADPNPEIGTLLEVDLPDSPGERFLKVLCGTGRTFVVPVPPGMRTALEANAEGYGLRPDELQELEIRT